MALMTLGFIKRTSGVSVLPGRVDIWSLVNGSRLLGQAWQSVGLSLINELISGSLFIRVSFQQWYKKINKRKGDENRENRKKKYFQAEDSSELHACISRCRSCNIQYQVYTNSKQKYVCSVCVLGGRGSGVVPFFLSVNFPIIVFNETRVRCVEGATGWDTKLLCDR